MDEYDIAFKPIMLPNGDWRPTENQNLADRLDYLDAYCKSINAYRGD